MQQLVYISVDHENRALWPDMGVWLLPMTYSFSKSPHHKASTNTQTSQGTKCSALWTFGGNFISITAAYSGRVVPQFPMLGPEKHQHVFPGLYSFSWEGWCYYDPLSFTCVWHFFFCSFEMSWEKIAYWSCLFRVLNTSCSWMPTCHLEKLTVFEEMVFFYAFGIFGLFIQTLYAF